MLRSIDGRTQIVLWTTLLRMILLLLLLLLLLRVRKSRRMRGVSRRISRC